MPPLRLLLLLGATTAMVAADDAQCSDVFQACYDSKCCSNPGFGCYKRTGKNYAQCKRKVANCVDTSDWQCPATWAQATDAYGDCRATLHCRREEDECQRRAHIYYAQCRPKKTSDCAIWEKDNEQNQLWLCPGWEQCAAAHEECTLSRCCTEPGFGCYLDEEKLARSEGWHAYCMPLHNHSSTASDASDGLAPPSDNAVPTDLLLTAVKSRSAINAIRNFTMALRASPRLCEGASTIFCRSIIRQGIEKHASYREYVEKVVLKYEKEISPLTFAFIFCGSILALFLVLLIGGVQFHRVRNRAIQAELELQALRVFTESNPRPGWQGGVEVTVTADEAAEMAAEEASAPPPTSAEASLPKAVEEPVHGAAVDERA